MSSLQMRTSKGAVLAVVVESIEWQYTSHGEGYRTTTADLKEGQYVTDNGYSVYRVDRVNGHGQPVLTYWDTDTERMDRAEEAARSA